MLKINSFNPWLKKHSQITYALLEEITQLKDAYIYGLTTIEHAFSCFKLDETVLFEIKKEHEKELKEKEKEVFFRKLRKTFSKEEHLSVEIIDDFIQNNALGIYEFLGFRANKENLLQYLNLSMKTIEELKKEQDTKLNSLKQKLIDEKEAIKIEKEKEHQLKVWRKTLIHEKEVPAYLNIKLSQFKRWRDDGRIPVAEIVNFKKMG